MTSAGPLSAIVSLTAWTWCAGLMAQEAPVPDGDATSPVIAASPSDFAWGSIVIGWSEPRYKIEAVRFKARDETGIDWLGSDEVIVQTFDAEGRSGSEVITGIDSGDTHEFAPDMSCIVPVPPGYFVLGKSSVCDSAGEPAPLGFQVELWERDPHWVPLPSFCPDRGWVNGGHSGPDNQCDYDDFIGHADIDLLPQDLEAVLHAVGDQYVETVVLNSCEDPDVTVCGGMDFADYTFTYRITRLPDVRTDLRSTLEVAMRRSGLRSTDAVIAGLRSLRAPIPRKIEPEPGNSSP